MKLQRRTLFAMWRRLAGWVLVAVLLGAAAYELAIALGAGTIGPEPGDAVTRAGP